MDHKEIELIGDESLSQKLIKRGFWLYFFSYLSAPLWYVIRVIISNSPEVSVADFGLLYGVISFITFLYTYNDLGLTESLQFFIPRFYLRKQYDNIKTTIYLSLFVQILTGIVISLLLRFGSDWLSIHYFKTESAGQILRYFCFYFLGMNILQVIQSIFSSLQKTFEFQCIEFVKVLSITIFTLYFFFVGGDIHQYSLSRILGVMTAVIFAFTLYAKYRKNIMKGNFNVDKTVLKKYTKYALWALIGNSIWNLFGQIILQMVIYILGVESAGYYTNFLSLFLIGNSILGPIMFLIFPLTSEYFEKSNKEAINRLISIFYNYFSILILSLSAIFIALGPEIATGLFGEKFVFSGKLLSIAGIFLCFHLLASFNYKILAGLGKVKQRVFITVISCIITIIVAYIGIKLGGLYGASIAFGISNICNWVLSLGLIKKYRYNYDIEWKFIIKNCILLIILGAIIYLGKSILPDLIVSRLGVIMYIICAGLLFYGIFGLCNIKTIKNFIKVKNHL